NMDVEISGFKFNLELNPYAFNKTKLSFGDFLSQGEVISEYTASNDIILGLTDMSVVLDLEILFMQVMVMIK
ncbi:hypothetical protein, partial [Acinetobacter baumannii]|uniref:hypothetical protein n=1 Tax=Acinetobacter baumannii TaxID=470 RepID=UPI001D18FC87